MLVCGYFGKRPSDRDFLFDGLPARVADRWAGMVSGWLQAAKTRSPAHWQETFYQSPIWRFALGPGHLNDQVWVGVLAASADAFGRSFPLTILISADHPALPANLTKPVDQVMDQIERVLLSFLDGNIARHAALKEIQIQGNALRHALAHSPGERRVTLPSLRKNEFAISLTIPALQDNPACPAGVLQYPAEAKRSADPSLCYWWHEGTETRPPELCVSAGLPTGQQAAAFFLGDWAQAGWRRRVEDSPIG